MSIDARDAHASVDGQPEDAHNESVNDAVIADTPAEPDACDPGTSKSPTESTCLISEKYGVFVSPKGSDTAGTGTRMSPYKTLGKALQVPKGNVNRVYACHEGTGYVDALAVDATLDGMTIYGGFECTGWTYATSRKRCESRLHWKSTL